ncbi:MAG: hypothetical protein WA133_02830, partial [Syntrophales bacterium]
GLRSNMEISFEFIVTSLTWAIALIRFYSFGCQSQVIYFSPNKKLSLSPRSGRLAGAPGYALF